VAADRQNFHPKSKAYIGFILTIDGTRIYHAGDTDLIPEMGTMKVDVALLPVSGTYVMTAKEAVMAAERIKPKVAIPMHYGSGVAGTEKDAEEFARLLQGKVQVQILKRGM
jgi:L-ascorbate metabolism protein UlaG (beta-lactamase superfamily)